MTAFWVSVVLVFLAEMGDKTQFATAALAARHSARTVLAALTVATLASHLLSVWLGRAAHLVLPDRIINLVAGVAFIGFGLWTLRKNDAADDDDGQPAGRRMPLFVALMLTFFVTELGDKTMLATVALGAQYPNLVAIWLGSTIGMLIADGLAIAVGRSLSERVPEHVLRPVAALIFFATGVVTIAHVLFFSGAAVA